MFGTFLKILFGKRDFGADEQQSQEEEYDYAKYLNDYTDDCKSIVDMTTEDVVESSKRYVKYKEELEEENLDYKASVLMKDLSKIQFAQRQANKNK